MIFTFSITVESHILLIMVGNIIVGFTLFFLLPKENLFENEKSQLTPFPAFSAESFLNKSYAKQIDIYANDAFPFREQLIELSAFYRDVKGIRSERDEIQIYNIQK
ncbi:DHHW family protein [Lysinibacillus sp. NPDC097214]|uniref:DHHW family protein n=1 Tax=Lysinibacillus sp. NPDC097214 TaxID=3390584 RepID=UPI003CFFA4EC